MSPLVKNLMAAAVAATLSTAAQAAPPPSYVIDPTQPVAGQSQLDLSQQWWQWLLGVPAGTNPNLDPDGSSAGVNNGGNVFFLAGNWGGTSTRTVSVPEGRPVFFPVLNAPYVFTPKETTIGEACLGSSVPDPVACALPYIDMGGATNPYARLDGVDLMTYATYASYRQTSDSLFVVDLPADNVFTALGIPVEAGPHDAVSDGYWVALAPLARGQHVLEFGGENSGFKLDVIDVLNVPEPPTLMIALSALAALALVRRRRAQV